MFAGTPAVALPALETLLGSSHEVVAVITRPDAPAGRGRVEIESPIARRAAAAAIEVLKPPRPVDPVFQQRLRELEPECIAVVAYGALVPPSALDIPPHGWVNLHFSLLPAWRGAAPVQHAILHGDDITGATTFVLEAGLDTGPVLGVMTETIKADDTSGDLLGRLSHAGAGLLVSTLDALESGELHGVAQSGEGVSLAPKISVQDARICWGEPALTVDRHIRGCTPAPGAWTMFRGQRLKIHPVTLAPDPAVVDGGEAIVAQVGPPEVIAPGVIAATKRAVLVGTASGAVGLGVVQPQGRKPMAAADWARGVRIESAEKFADA